MTSSRLSSIKPPNPKTSHEYFVSAFIKPIHEDFFNKAIKILIDESIFFNDVQESPFEFKHPKELVKLVDITLRENGTSHEELLKVLKSVCRFSPHCSHPYYLDKVSSGLDPYAIAGDWLGSTMTTVLALYLVSPVFTLMEIEITKKLCSLVGFPDTGASGGITTPGSGIANIMAVSCAMQWKFPDFKKNGFGSIKGKTPLIFISENASPSFEKAMIMGGFSRASLVQIEVDQWGRMSMEHLKETIAKAKACEHMEKIPVMIIGTAGSPVTGAIDPLFEIGNICQKEGCCFHVDADLGGGALLSFTQIKRLRGIEKSNSVTFGTWMLCLPQTTSFLLTRDYSILQSTFGYQATYLYTGNDVYDPSYDRGDCTLQTSRRPDVLKFWYSWNSRGRSGLTSHVDKCYANSETFLSLLKDRLGFNILTQNVGIPLVSFQYIPQGIRKFTKASNIIQARLSMFTERLQATLLLGGVMQVSISSLFGTNCLSVSFCNSNLKIIDLNYILDQIESFGERLEIPYLNDPTDPLETSNLKWNLPSKIQPPIQSTRSEHKLWATSPKRANYEQFFKNVMQLFLKTGIFYEDRRNEPPHRFRRPKELRKLYEFKLRDLPLTHAELLKDMETVIYYSVKPGHLYYMYQLLSGQDPYTLIADFFVTTLNTPMMKYEESPVFTLMENEVMRKVRNRVFGNENGDGLVTDGGSMSNQISVSLAIQRKFPGISENGIASLGGKNLKFFVSEDGHFSFAKGAVLKGIGAQSGVCVKTNTLGKMIVEDLVAKIEKCVQDGDVPFLVVATTGTTVYGSIDPVAEIGEVCQKYNMWYHVDACFGGPVMFSDNHRHLLNGIQRADSIAINFHKMLASNLTTSLLVTRHQNIIRDTFGSNGTDEVEDKFLNSRKWDNGGDAHIQSSRRNNMFKFWLLWKAKGRQGIGKHVDHIMNNAKYAVKAIISRPGFISLLEKFELTNICFYFIPKSLRQLDINSIEFRDRFSKVSFEIEKLLVKNEIMSIVAQRRATGNSHVFFKLVLMNSAITFEDIDYILNQIEFFGNVYDKSVTL